MIQDFIGNEFEISSKHRIVSLVPSITETLFDLGLEDSVIGVTRYCIYPPLAKNRVVVGGTKSPKMAKIKELKPDLIFVNQEENMKSDYEELSNIAPTFVTFPKSIEAAISMLTDIAYLLEVEPTRISSLENDYNEILNKVKSYNFTKKTVFCPIWKNPWMTINRDTYVESILNLFNLQNIYSDLPSRYPNVDFNDLKSQVDLVLLPNEPYDFKEKDIIELKTHKPFKNSIYTLIDGSYLTWYGTRTIKALNYFYDIFEAIQ